MLVRSHARLGGLEFADERRRGPPLVHFAEGVGGALEHFLRPVQGVQKRPQAALADTHFERRDGGLVHVHRFVGEDELDEPPGGVLAGDLAERLAREFPHRDAARTEDARDGFGGGRVADHKDLLDAFLPGAGTHGTEIRDRDILNLTREGQAALLERGVLRRGRRRAGGGEARRVLGTDPFHVTPDVAEGLAGLLVVGVAEEGFLPMGLRPLLEADAVAPLGQFDVGGRRRVHRQEAVGILARQLRRVINRPRCARQRQRKRHRQKQADHGRLLTVSRFAAHTLLYGHRWNLVSQKPRRPDHGAWQRFLAGHDFLGRSVRTDASWPAPPPTAAGHKARRYNRLRSPEKLATPGPGVNTPVRRVYRPGP